MVPCIRISSSIRGWTLRLSMLWPSISELGVVVLCDGADDVCSDTIHNLSVVYFQSILITMTYQMTEDGECHIYQDRRALAWQLVAQLQWWLEALEARQRSSVSISLLSTICYLRYNSQTVSKLKMCHGQQRSRINGQAIMSLAEG